MLPFTATPTTVTWVVIFRVYSVLTGSLISNPSLGWDDTVPSRYSIYGYLCHPSCAHTGFVPCEPPKSENGVHTFIDISGPHPSYSVPV
jgi:hypothetical protein